MWLFVNDLLENGGIRFSFVAGEVFPELTVCLVWPRAFQFEICQPLVSWLISLTQTTGSILAAKTVPTMVSMMAEEEFLDKSHWFIDKFEVVQVLILVEYLFMFVMCSALALYLRRNRHIALTGDSRAARKILLPAFAPLLWLLGCTVGIYSVVMLVLVSLKWRERDANALLEIFYSMRLFVFGLVMVFLLQKSVSVPALRRSVMITLILALYTLPVEILLAAYVESSFPNLAFVVMSCVRALMLVFFAYVFMRPPARASKRTLRQYCLFVFTYSVLYFSSELFFHLGENSVGFALTYATVLWTILSPIIIWRVLKADTEFWRGLGKRAVELQSLFRQRHSTFDERISSQGLHVLIEMHRKLIIDFAQLKLEKKIGTGASAVVFSGVLDATTPVAVKVYTPTLFSEETVAEFSQEAALCGALKHPNIVRFHGMCVYPPTICLVSELCQGTLGEVTCAARNRFTATGHNRQQMLLNVCYMLDAARAVAYLHSFSPPFLHRDIKPDNFLVDVHGSVKLTDFGESRSLARSLKTVSVATSRDSTDYAAFANSQSMMLSYPKMTVKGTVDYMAPEIINGKAGLAAYDEAADVYSLAMTMWDVLHPGSEKFPEHHNNHLQVFASVMEGRRPELKSEADGELHLSLREIIEAAWQPNAQLRPKAQDIVKVLESVQEELLSVFATKLLPELSNDISSSDDIFTGELIVARLQDMKFLHSPCEAIRLGNAFMDAGLLHHKKHACCFENTSLKYFFDEGNIRLCQPLEMEEQSVAIGVIDALDNDLEQQQERFGSSSSSSRRGLSSTCSFSEDHSSVHHNPTGSKPFSISEVFARASTGCRCRKLGRRLETSKTARKQRIRRKFKTAIADDIVLTTKLLEGDDTGIPSEFEMGHTLDGFDFVVLAA